MARGEEVFLRQKGQYSAGSVAARVFGFVILKAEMSITSLFIWTRKAYDHSIFGTFLTRVQKTWAALLEASLFLKICGFLFRLAFFGIEEDGNNGEKSGISARGQSRLLRPEVLLGFSLGISAVLPTEFLFLTLLASWILILFNRTSGISVGVFSGVLSDDSRETRIFSFPKPDILGFLVVLFFFLVGATVTSVVPRQSLTNLIIWCFYLFAFFVCYDAGIRRKEEHVILPVLAFASISGLIGIYQHLTGWVPPRSWLDEKFEDEIVRVVGTFSNPTFFAEMLGLALPLAIALFLKKRGILQRILLLAYAGVQLIALVLTYSRGAWIGFICSFAILAVLYERKFLILGLVFGMLLLVLAPKVIVERLVSSFTLNDSSNSYRVFIWRGSFALLRDNLFRGVGLGAESFKQVYPEYMIIQTPAPHAHSTYVEMLIELGLPGFTVLAFFLLSWAWKVFRAIIKERLSNSSDFLGGQKKRWERIGVMAGLFSAIGGHMVQALVEHTWYSPRITILYWAFLGLALGIASSGSREDGGNQKGSPRGLAGAE